MKIKNFFKHKFAKIPLDEQAILLEAVPQGDISQGDIPQEEYPPIAKQSLAVVEDKEYEYAEEIPLNAPVKASDVIIVQGIICVTIAIIFVLLSTYKPQVSNLLLSEIKRLEVTDFSFQEQAYDSIGRLITRLNEIKPVNINDGVSEDTEPVGGHADDYIDDSELTSDLNGEGGNATPISPPAIPSNATLTPVVYTGNIIFPLKAEYRVTSQFGFRESPFTAEQEFHSATDIAAAEKSKIYAVANGVVVKSGESDSLGKYIIIDHGSNFFTTYGHCSSLNVTEGTRVRQGEIIGKVGNTGYSTGNHLHLAMQKDGLYFDPAYIFKDELNDTV